MPVRIRLKRMGRKKAPHYRIVVADSAAPRDGRFVETLGYYKPTYDPARVVVDLERVDHWIGQGALPSDTVTSLLRKVRRGGDSVVRVGEPDPDETKADHVSELAARRQTEKNEREAAATEATAAKASEEAPAAEADSADEAAGDEEE